MNIASPEKLYQSRSIQIGSFSLIAALFLYPFSIAGSNFFFAILLLLAFYQKEMIIHGINVCWNEYRAITIGILLFVFFTFVGSLWSSDMSTASHKMGKQLNWLIIPAIIGLVHFNPRLRPKLFLSLSIGMFLHLFVCTLQYMGVITINELGSFRESATGFVGHLNFGFLYGIWVGTLLIVAQRLPRKWAALCYIASFYAVITTFLAQGRSGYIIMIVMILLVTWKVLFPDRLKLKLTLFSLFLTFIALFFSFHQPSQEKVLKTVAGVQAFFEGDWAQVDERIRVWGTSIEIWKENPWFGIGTGDYHDTSVEILNKAEFAHLRQAHDYSHSHNEFLFELVRWGPLGLLATIYLCWSWFVSGWRKDWRKDTMNAYLGTASGLCIIIHGMTEVSLNGQTATVFAIIILALSMTKKHPQDIL